mmetsp:Transcript_76038/g.204018  ORF Transcript_76038/g.204018 Transcript_76038/m.204018 type:complete len:157 (-) Transcript_76038:763-1233(-)
MVNRRPLHRLLSCVQHVQSLRLRMLVMLLAWPWRSVSWSSPSVLEVMMPPVQLLDMGLGILILVWFLGYAIKSSSQLVNLGLLFVASRPFCRLFPVECNEDVKTHTHTRTHARTHKHTHTNNAANCLNASDDVVFHEGCHSPAARIAENENTSCME